MLEKPDEILTEEELQECEVEFTKLLASHKAQSEYIELQDVAGKEWIEENERLRAALQLISQVETSSWYNDARIIKDIAEEALEVKP